MDVNSVILPQISNTENLSHASYTEDLSRENNTEDLSYVRDSEDLSHVSDTIDQYLEESESPTTDTLGFESDSVNEDIRTLSFISTTAESITILPKKKAGNKKFSEDVEDSENENSSWDEKSDETEDNSNCYIKCLIIVMVIILIGGIYSYVNFGTGRQQSTNQNTTAEKENIIDTKANVQIDKDLKELSKSVIKHIEDLNVQMRMKNTMFKSRTTDTIDWPTFLVDEMSDYATTMFTNDSQIVHNTDAMHKFDEKKKSEFNDIAQKFKTSIKNDYFDYAISTDLTKLTKLVSDYMTIEAEQVGMIKDAFKSTSNKDYDWSAKITEKMNAKAKEFTIHPHISHHTDTQRKFDAKKKVAFEKLIKVLVVSFEQKYTNYAIQQDVTKISTYVTEHIEAKNVQTTLFKEAFDKKSDGENIDWSSKVLAEMSSHVEIGFTCHPYIDNNTDVLNKFLEEKSIVLQRIAKEFATVLELEYYRYVTKIENEVNVPEIKKKINLNEVDGNNNQTTKNTTKPPYNAINTCKSNIDSCNGENVFQINFVLIMFVIFLSGAISGFLVHENCCANLVMVFGFIFSDILWILAAICLFCHEPGTHIHLFLLSFPCAVMFALNVIATVEVMQSNNRHIIKCCVWWKYSSIMLTINATTCLILFILLVFTNVFN